MNLETGQKVNDTGDEVDEKTEEQEEGDENQASQQTLNGYGDLGESVRQSSKSSLLFLKPQSNQRWIVNSQNRNVEVFAEKMPSSDIQHSETSLDGKFTKRFGNVDNLLLSPRIQLPNSRNFLTNRMTQQLPRAIKLNSKENKDRGAFA